MSEDQKILGAHPRAGLPEHSEVEALREAVAKAVWGSRFDSDMGHFAADRILAIPALARLTSLAEDNAKLRARVEEAVAAEREACRIIAQNEILRARGNPTDLRTVAHRIDAGFRARSNLGGPNV